MIGVDESPRPRRRGACARPRRPRSGSSCTPATSPTSRSCGPTRSTSRSATARSRASTTSAALFRQVHRVLRHGAAVRVLAPAPVRARHRGRADAEGALPLGRTVVARSYFDPSPIDVGDRRTPRVLTRAHARATSSPGCAGPASGSTSCSSPSRPAPGRPRAAARRPSSGGPARRLVSGTTPPVPRRRARWSGSTAVGYDALRRASTRSRAPPAAATLTMSGDPAFRGDPRGPQPRAAAARGGRRRASSSRSSRSRRRVPHRRARATRTTPRPTCPRTTRRCASPRSGCGPRITVARRARTSERCTSSSRSRTRSASSPTRCECACRSAPTHRRALPDRAAQRAT